MHSAFLKIRMEAYVINCTGNNQVNVDAHTAVFIVYKCAHLAHKLHKNAQWCVTTSTPFKPCTCNVRRNAKCKIRVSGYKLNKIDYYDE